MVQELVKQATEWFMKAMEGAEGLPSMEQVQGAMADLLGGQNLTDLQALAGRLSQGGLLDLAESVMGGKAGLSREQVEGLLGAESIGRFARQLGLNDQEALDGLAQALPNLLQGAKGGFDQLLGSAGSVLGKFLK